MKYWIIDLEDFGISEGAKEAHGPFKSIADAEKWLKDNAEENFRLFNEPEKLGEHHNWAAPVLIVEEKTRIKQVPVVSFKIKLEAAK
jgi:hypothetical protein